MISNSFSLIKITIPDRGPRFSVAFMDASDRIYGLFAPNTPQMAAKNQNVGLHDAPHKALYLVLTFNMNGSAPSARKWYTQKSWR